MFDSGYFITAELRVKDQAQIVNAKSALVTLCQKTLTEPGCSLFSLHQCEQDPARFLLWERFDDEAAFKQHFEETHTKDYIRLDLTDIVQHFQSNIVSI
ncbi:putative quinol monooxygenase [Agaribacterium haliotis]|uniref:putative quinol monooxygenase n=1 Tax=Agaribacterium haliotis TaxID=2013869 RepID=UPI000BB5508C|nr:antibiotic biosynthesis monooxygenase [Agaribacterium haliotis]